MNLYEKRGVAANKADVHQAIKNLDKGLYPNAFCKILPDYVAHDPDYCTIMHSDTAGTKTSLAYIYWKETGDLNVWKGIVQDAMVMNIDDMACSGLTTDIVVSATLARNKKLIPGEVVSTIIRYAQEFADKMAGLGVQIHLAGGETADVGDIVRTADVGYTTFGRMKRADVIQMDIEPGDYVVGLASYGQASYEDEYNGGMGCNGLTSARHDLFSAYYREKYPESFDPSMPVALSYAGSRRLEETITINGQSVPLGKLVLSPTRTYLPVLKSLFDQTDRSAFSGIVHNTGGGMFKVNHFLKKDVCVVKEDIIGIPPLFQLIREETGVGYDELFNVFNMGTRMEFYTRDKDTAEFVVATAQKFQIEGKIIGRVTRAHKPGTQIVYEGQTYFRPVDQH